MKALKKMDENIQIVNKFTKIRNKYNKFGTKKLKMQYEQQYNLCVEAFKYLVTSKLYKYQQFSNYEDLFQEGMIGLMSALRTYKPRKGNFYSWASKYIKTKIVRAASAHNTIQIPINRAKEVILNRTNIMPNLSDNCLDSYEQINLLESYQEIIRAIHELSPRHRKILIFSYGLGGIKPYSTSKISEKLNISMNKVAKIRTEAIETIKQYIKA